ncbi:MULTISPECIES: signal recognition particle protein [Parafrankia]|uniref:Signal recognition particle protein n=1 Tax=Parafrankia soli TaxID=2599596 RepID=A0A1S1R4T1_9ACTN|nr:MULTISPECIES: signal recognition particle protein [Parafrankia]OHV40515.1 signal recognition particle protein [Parafrankia soli]TCJ36405.1 signal recognition particle protein [Parafrankia sp. BMG5.11]CAI7980383.1 signal recognition particle-like (SRP) GTPase [Frankia sp. Hr75.2]SQD94629.1 signal recognition particle-like (SRP) GTPase [Parafrankia sp. Ea1.12]
MFDTLSSRLDKVFTSLRGRGRLTDADIDATAREIRVALLEADVALPVVRGFVAAIRERARGAEVSTSLNPAQQVIKIVNEELVAILGGGTTTLRFAKTPPTVILLAGLQGTGKTTLAGKLGRWLRAQGHTPLLVAADLQRPNAVNQLQVVGQRAGVEVFAPEPGNGVGDPVRVARDALAHARRHVFDVVVVDTAGRLGVDEELMRQAADIRDAVSPDEILFVLDAMIGQDAVSTAQAFADGVGFTGVVLTKLDGDARGGAALSVARVTGAPIMFASTGETLDDFDVFHPERMASRILGMGDMLTLIEQAEKAFEVEQAEAMAVKMANSEFTLEDFLEQMLTVRKMGPIGNLLGMLPGMGQIKDQLAQVDDRDLDRVVAIIRSMTPAERRDPKILQASRKARVARGSGVTVTEVNQLLDRFGEARKMMRQMAGGAGLPAGMARAKAAQARKAAKKGKGARRSGNPAARAAQAQDRRNAPQDGPPALGLGGDGLQGMPDLSSLIQQGGFGGGDTPPRRPRPGR